MKFRCLLVLMIVGIMQMSFTGRDRYSDFINDISHDYVPDDYPYFLLIDTGHATFFSDIFEGKIRDSVIKSDPDFAAMTKDSFEIDSSIINWRNYGIKRARFLSKDSVDYFYFNNRKIGFRPKKKYNTDSLNKTKSWNKIFIPLREPSSAKKRKKLLDQYGDSLEKSIPKEHLNVWTFGKPLFSKNGRYAVIWIGQEDKSTNLYLYKKDQAHWRKLVHLFSFQ